MIKKIKTAFFLFIPHISLSNIAIMFVFKSQVHLLVMNLFFEKIGDFRIIIPQFSQMSQKTSHSPMLQGKWLRVLRKHR
ncbi:hypothetical protein IB49_00385 [Geobacillus sp. LC300]|nr:hypothetical protein IB49_00385 [Geobacillus sp. LC300]